VIVFVAFLLYQNSRVEYLTLATGSSSGESYIISAALKRVVERHYRGIKITLLETGGTVENLKLLENGQAQLAVAQADVLAGPAARILAVLYEDTFQLLTRLDSPVQSFAALSGKTIALPRTGGQFQSFLRVAGHFGLEESDFKFIGSTDATADKAFLEGRADAVFRVRALGNPSIQHLVRTGRFRMVRIDHAAAMKINHPAFDPSVIPAGAYMGNPAVPAEDLPSISVHRTLLASSRVGDEIVRAVTGVLIDYREEIAREIPDQTAEVRLLLAQVHRPLVQSQLGPTLHPGAVKFYEKDKPSFILAHADYMGLMLTVLVMVGSWILELKAWLQRRQKNIADDYSNRVIVLMNAARQAKTQPALAGIRDELLGILSAAVNDLDNDKLSEESFHSFRSILQIGLEVVRDNWMVLQPTVRIPRQLDES
jgi:TRAP transporter TAXI family solute receptor